MYISKMRTLKAVLGTAFFVFIMSFILGVNSEIAHSPAGFSGGLLIASIATVIGLVSIVVWALPVHLFLTYKNIKFMRWYALAGFAPSIIMVFVANFFGKDPLGTQLVQVVPLGIFGAISACVFCYLVNGKNT